MSCVTRIWNLFRRSSLDGELDEEIRFHLHDRTVRNIARGMSPDVAEAEARRQFGSIERAKAGMRAARLASVASILLPALLILSVATGAFLATRPRIYDVTADISAPVPIRAPRVEYTAAAMRQKIQGTLRLECVVGTDGACSAVKVIRSLDRTFGLDEQAVRTLGEWRFRPGLRRGEPVATRIKLDLKFALR